MSSTSNGIPAGRLAQYAMLVASVPGLERRGSKAPYTSLNGNKSSFLTDTGSLALRLDADGRYAFMREHRAQLCERHGRVMKEYVAVPEGLWKERIALRRAFVSSVAYVGSLKPKVSKRKKPVVARTVPLDRDLDKDKDKDKVEKEPATVTSRTTVTHKAVKKSVPKKAAEKTPAASKKPNGVAKKAAARARTTRKAEPKKAAAKRTTVRRKAVAS